MKIQTLAIAFMSAVTLGGLAWVFLYPLLSGERQAEKRRASFSRTEAATRRIDRNQRSRREQVEDTLKDVEDRAKQAKKVPLNTRLAQAGVSWSRRQFIIGSAALGLLVFFICFVTGANLIATAALALSAVFNTAANRRFTFGRRGREGLVTHHFQGLVVFGFCLGLTTLALAGLGALAPDASQAVEVAVLVAANAGATLLRYWLLRLWVFGPRGAAPGGEEPELQGLTACPTPRPRPRATGRTTTRETRRA